MTSGISKGVPPAHQLATTSGTSDHSARLSKPSQKENSGPVDSLRCGGRMGLLRPWFTS